MTLSWTTPGPSNLAPRRQHRRAHALPLQPQGQVGSEHVDIGNLVGSTPTTPRPGTGPVRRREICPEDVDNSSKVALMATSPARLSLRLRLPGGQGLLNPEHPLPIVGRLALAQSRRRRQTSMTASSPPLHPHPALQPRPQKIRALRVRFLDAEDMPANTARCASSCATLHHLGPTDLRRLLHPHAEESSSSSCSRAHSCLPRITAAAAILVGGFGSPTSSTSRSRAHPESACAGPTGHLRHILVQFLARPWPSPSSAPWPASSSPGPGPIRSPAEPLEISSPGNLHPRNGSSVAIA
jgi:hypothetical protein